MIVCPHVRGESESACVFCRQVDLFPTEGIYLIELETGGQPQQVVGGIAASGFYHFQMIEDDGSLRKVGRHERR